MCKGRRDITGAYLQMQQRISSNPKKFNACSPFLMQAALPSSVNPAVPDTLVTLTGTYPVVTFRLSRSIRELSCRLVAGIGGDTRR